jgi:hypothetical protein
VNQRTLFASIAIAICVGAVGAQEQDKTQTIQALVRTDPWKGWGGGEPLPPELKKAQEPEKFERYATSPGGTPQFEGKVEGLKPGENGEVGIISLVGTHWIKRDNYQWSRVKSDGTFEVTVDKQPEARKTVVFRAKDHPWVFLRAEFEPGESARNIVLRIPVSKKVLITAEDSQGERVKSFATEVFNSYEIYDDAGKKLKAQRYDQFSTSNGELELDLANEPRALLIGGAKIAPYYQVIDPRQADRFHFRMLAPARVTGIVTRGKTPVPTTQVYIVNEAAPLSASIRKTDANGKFDIPGRVPGLHHMAIGGKELDVKLDEGQTKELNVDIAEAP